MRSLAVLGALVALLAGAAGPAAPPQLKPGHSIVVIGQGSVKTVPDRAQLSLGVSTDAKTAAAALRANAAEMAKVIAAIKAQGIPAADIRTDQVSLSLRFGATVRRSSATRRRTPSRHHPQHGRRRSVIDAAVDAGANQVYGPNLVRSDQQALYRTAMRAAISNAAREGGRDREGAPGCPPADHRRRRERRPRRRSPVRREECAGPRRRRSSRAPSSSRRRRRLRSGPWRGDRALAGRGDERRVLREHAALVARRRAASSRAAARRSRRRRARRAARRASTSIVTVSPSWSAAIGPPRNASGATWPTMKPWVAPEKRPSVISATASPSPSPMIAAGDLQHLGHPRAAGRALVADHDDVARLDRLRLHRGEGVRLVVEHARRPAVELAVDRRA